MSVVSPTVLESIVWRLVRQGGKGCTGAFLRDPYRPLSLTESACTVLRLTILAVIRCTASISLTDLPEQFLLE